MSDKIKSLSAERNKKKPRSLESSVEAAARNFLDKIPDDLEEPESFASGGDMTKISEEEDTNGKS